MPRRRDITLPKGTFSFSQFRLEKQCAACYEQRYVVGKPMVKGSALITGSAIHASLAVGRRALKAGQDLNVQLLADAANDGFDGAIKGLTRSGDEPAEPPVLKLNKSDKDWASVKDKAIATAKFTVMEVLRAESKHQMVAIEAEVAMHGVFPFPFAAYTDRMLDDEAWESFGHIGDDKSAGKDSPPHVWPAWH